jgi:hypothetical protein
MPTFITPFTGTAELTVATGLEIQEQGLWRFSEAGYNDGATFGVSLYHPRPTESGVLRVRAQNWTIADIGTALSAYTDPDTGITYGADRCRIEVRGQWQVARRPNSNSYESIGVEYTGITETDQGGRTMDPYLLALATTPLQTYRIQGAAVDGGAQDTFSQHEFFCRCEHTVRTDNSNRLFVSNSIARPAWVYTYSKSWQTD